MRKKLKEIWSNIKLYGCILIYILGFLSIPVNIFFFLGKGGWNILDVFILLALLVLFFAPM